MRNVTRLLLVIVVLALASFTLAAQAPAPPAGAQAPQQEKMFSGTLVKVDAQAKAITAKGADNKEMTFRYTDDTEIAGAEKTVQGLASKSGAKLSITYKVDRGANVATSIEVLP